eukprot:3496146-Pyramimonas_sp.AAC.1
MRRTGRWRMTGRGGRISEWSRRARGDILARRVRPQTSDLFRVAKPPDLSTPSWWPVPGSIV